jgi:hypothetical protein
MNGMVSIRTEELIGAALATITRFFQAVDG